MSEGRKPRKRFGQHFLRDPDTIRRIVDAVSPADADHLVEIGPGLGALTEPLACIPGVRLTLIELDRDLAGRLTRRFHDQSQVHVHQGDALRFDFAELGQGLRLVGNLPYNVSTPLLFHLLSFQPRIIDMHFMLQKEVVDRIIAEPGNKQFGRLTIMLGCSVEAEALFDVDADAFDPPPRVLSSVVRLTPRAAKGRLEVNTERLNALVTHAFAKRRKTLHNALKGLVTDSDLQAVGIDPAKRPEQVPIASWVALANARDGH